MAKLCPICDQEMEIIVVSCKNSHFIDDKTYPRMCFGCFHVPANYIQYYKKSGEVDYEEGPFWDHKHLNNAKELVRDGACDNLSQARKCINGVKEAIKKAGLTGRKKPKKKTKPKQQLQLP